MKLKVLFLSIITANTIMAVETNEISKDISNFNKETIETKTQNKDFTETIQLMPKEEKMRMIQEHMRKIEAQKAKLADLMEQGKEIKEKIENKIEDNNKQKEIEKAKILEYQKQLADIKNNLKEVHEKISTEKERDLDNIAITKNANFEIVSHIPLLNKEGAKEVKFNLKNGKVLNLIEYKIQKNDTLSDIVSKTFIGKATWVQIEERLNVVVKMNKNIKDMNKVKEGEKIYIPYFK